MLKTISCKKRYLFLPFLALFYFVIGAHALHPYFHEQIETLPDDPYQHVHSRPHHHPPATDLVVGSDHHVCPICKFFAANSALDIGAVRFFIPSFPDQHVNNGCRIAVIFAHPTGFHIRGPPSVIPS